MDVERDFELMGTLLHPPVAPDIEIERGKHRCTNGCNVKLVKKPSIYRCPKSGNQHICGGACQRMVLSRSCYSCPLTGLVCDKPLFSEVANKGMYEFQRGIGVPNTTSGDSRDHNTHVRARQACIMAHTLCATPESFVDACVSYYRRLVLVKGLFTNAALTERRILHFALACCWLLSSGLTVNMVELFPKRKDFQSLPKTHRLIEAKIRINSITKQEVLIKKAILADKTNIARWKFPEF